MKIRDVIGRVCVAAACLFMLVSCTARPRAMLGYYENHPEMMEKLIGVRKIFVKDVKGAKDAGTAGEMKKSIVEELWRKGKGRFTVVGDPASADALLAADMEKELGPLETEEPLPFELEPKFSGEDEVFVRMTLVEPKSGGIIYKTTSEEYTDIEVDTVSKAAHAVISNLMREIAVGRGIMGGRN